MADTTLDATLDAIAAAAARRYVVSISKDVIYYFGIDATTKNLCYWKTTSASTSPSTTGPTTIYTAQDAGPFIVYYDKWTPGNTGTKIYIVWQSATDQSFWRSLDTASNTLGTQEVVGTAPLDTSNFTDLLQGNVETVVARGGNLYLYSNANTATLADEWWYSTDAGANWTEGASPNEAVDDLLLLFPANETDQNDVAALYWDKSANAITVKQYSKVGDSWTESATLITATMDIGPAGNGFWPWSATLRHSDGKVLLAVKNGDPETSTDIEFWEVTITGTPAATQLTDVITADECACPDVWINQNTDAIRVGYIKASTALQTDGLTYFKESTDDGSTWGSEQAYGETADDLKSVCSPAMILSGADGIYTLTWVNDDLNDLVTNWVNADVITTGGSNYNQSAAGSMGTLSATLVLKTGKALSGVSGSYSATLARLTGKALTGTNGSSSAELAKSTTKSFAGTMGDLSATLSAIKTALVAVSGAVGDLTGSIARQVNKALVGVSGSVSGTLVKLTSKAFSGADGGLSGALNASAGKFVELAGVAGDLAGTLAKQTLKSLSGATDTVSGAISKQINKALSGASGSVSGTLSSSVYKVVELAGAAGNLTGTLTRSIAKSLAGTAGSVSGSIAKAISKSFSGTMGALSGSFTTFAPTEYLQSITGSISSITGSVTMAMVFRRAKMKAGYAIRSIINGGRRLTD